MQKVQSDWLVVDDKSSFRQVQYLVFRRRLIDSIDNEEVDEETLKERESVRQQIHRKYVLLGQWNQFDDDEKQDIVLAETMIYRQQQIDSIDLIRHISDRKSVV